MEKGKTMGKDNTEYSFRAFYNQKHFVADLIRKYQKWYYTKELQNINIMQKQFSRSQINFCFGMSPSHCLLNLISYY